MDTDTEYSVKVGKNYLLDLEIDEVPCGGTFTDEIKGLTFEQVVECIFFHENPDEQVVECMTLNNMPFDKYSNGEYVHATGEYIHIVGKDSDYWTIEYEDDNYQYSDNCKYYDEEQLSDESDEPQSESLERVEWQNTGMPKQLTWIFTVPSNFPEDEKVLGNAVGDVFAVNHNATIAFRFHDEDEEGITYVDVLSSHLTFNDVYVDDDDRENGYGTPYDHKSNAHIFATNLNDILINGCCSIYSPIEEQLRQFNAENNLGLVFITKWNPEEYCEETIVYTSDSIKFDELPESDII